MSAGVERATAHELVEQPWAQEADPGAPPLPEDTFELPAYEQEPEAAAGRPVLAGFLILLTVAWFLVCGIILYRTWPAADLLNLVNWVATMSVPPALIALTWLVFGRSSRRESEKFTRSVAAMRGEAQALDRVLALVAERIETNRTQLSEDTARLMKLGEEASDRLGRVTHYLSREADGLQATSQQVESAAAQARVDVGVLLADLPQAEQAARSFSETLREAGMSAHERARALEAQLSAIGARAQDADVVMGGAAERLGAHIARIDSSAGVASQQLEEAAARLDAAVDGALGRTSEAVESTRVALDAQSQALFAAVEQSRGRFVEAGADAARTLTERLDEVQAMLTRQAQALFGTIDDGRSRLAEADAEASRAMTERLAAMQSALAAQNQELSAAIEAGRSRVSEADAEAGRAMSERLEALQGALSGQAETLFATIDEGRTRLIETGSETGGQLTERLESARQLVTWISRGLDEQEEKSQKLVANLASQISKLDDRLVAVGERADGQSTQMAGALASLRDATATLRQEVDASTQEAVALVGRTHDMAGALDQVSERLRGELPAAMADVESKAAAMRDTALAAVEPVQALQAAAAEGAGRLVEAEQLVGRSRESLQALLEGIDSGVEQIDQRLRELAGAASQADDAASLLVRETGPELVEALVRVREAARAAASHAREAITAVIPESAASLSEASRSALGDAVTETVRQQIGELEATSQRAAAAARKASERLTRQLLTLGEGAAALEAKIEEERALRDEHAREGMPRRVALLIESLNSTAIDVTKILSNEVTDSAWQAYLKGDRGVFTRRAVRLLESGEAREIQRHYDQEAEFREQVNRYISDFEAMLRRVLADGEGNALAVTLLSSDMGKLYVALAQAIQHIKV